MKILSKRAIEIANKYDQLNAKRGVKWNEQDLMAGFVGDVGDLSKIIMAKHGLRELADCLWCVMVLSDKYKIDMAAEFLKTMDDLAKRKAQKIAKLLYSLQKT